MKINKILLSILFAAILNSPVPAQSDSSIFLNGYKEKDYHKYFDSIHATSNSAIQNLKHSYSCWVVIKVDTAGNFSDFEMIEVPAAPLPDTARKYIRFLFNSTAGKWSTKKHIGGKSDDIVFTITLQKSDQALRENMDDSVLTLEYMITGASKHPRLKKITTMKDVTLFLPFRKT